MSHLGLCPQYFCLDRPQVFESYVLSAGDAAAYFMLRNGTHGRAVFGTLALSNITYIHGPQ